MPWGPDTPPYGGLGGDYTTATDSSAASGVLTASGTPPSPANTVMVSYHGAARAAAGADPVSTAGECVVVLRGSTMSTVGSNGHIHSDPQGGALLDSLKQAVQEGTLSLRQAASAVAQHLKERKDTSRVQNPLFGGDHRQQQLGQASKFTSLVSGVGRHMQTNSIGNSSGHAMNGNGISLWGETPEQQGPMPSLFSGWEFNTTQVNGFGLASSHAQQAFVSSSSGGGDGGGGSGVGRLRDPCLVGEVTATFAPSALGLSMHSGNNGGKSGIRKGPPPGFVAPIAQQEMQSSIFLQSEYATGMR